MNACFSGFYFKCQSEAHTLAVIPAVHGETCSVQVITDEGAFRAVYPAVYFKRNGQRMQIAGSLFGPSGLLLDVRAEGLTARGTLRFGPLTPPRYDIMGPFALVPRMECRHEVHSLCHTVDGTLTVNGVRYAFAGARGYWEGDRGRSFPRVYAWTHAFVEDASVMLSVAEIPFAGWHFTGVIGTVYRQGREVRLATYLGARVVRLENGEITVRQGGKELSVRLLERRAHPLDAPVQGEMTRTIHESAACRAWYAYREQGEVVFERETGNASFEYEYLK